MDLLKDLNKNQIEAVTLTEGPVMVMAGAGSGKTKVLTTRISYIIEELGIAPSQILAVTFTNKAANEMKSRIEAMLGIDTRFMWISTFHSFCARLLRLEIDKMPPFNKNFVILDEEDSTKLIKEVLKELDIDEKAKEFKHLISKSKNFTNFSIKDPKVNDLFTIVNRRYEEKCKENNLLDFDDLIIFTIKLFRSNPLVLEKYQDKFNYILVDEFQDTNDLQYELVHMLSRVHNNLFVVGDDFQSIYSFRGAKIENINKFRRDFKNHKLVLLEQNYRSTTQILNLANDIIKKNPNQIKKEMFTIKKDGILPYYYKAYSSYDEAVFVVNKIAEEVRKGRNYSDFAIMYRVNYITRNFEDILVRNKIPYTIYGGMSFFARTEIKDMIAYLRLLINPKDDFSFERIVNVPKRKIGKVILDKLKEISSSNDLSLYEAIDYVNGSGIGINNLKAFKIILESIKANIELVSLKETLNQIVKQIGYEEELKKDEDTYQDRIENINEFQSVLAEAEEEYEDLSHYEMFESLLSDLALRSENDDIKEVNSVKLTTFHQAKGLEFPVVFMVAMEEGIFPSMNIFSNEEMEEERRICYVGVTRAKEELYLTSSENRLRFGKTESMIPSTFLKEMNKELYYNSTKPKTVIKKKEVETTYIKKEENGVNLFSVGDKINHKIFGNGMVVKVEGETISVAFPMPTGIKKLKANHPSLRKL
ncbi:MAG: UvrD-helicase domain-containing protein [Acholeplasmatales bacterium]|nr:UvrD-helicase domain-containing protein [Acholeplasmatales bacterium]